MRILDTTLREGEQRFGVYFPPEIRKQIALHLRDIGIDELEIGVTKPDEELEWLWSNLMNQGLSGRLSLWCRLKKEDIDIARKFNGIRLNLSTPVSDIQLERRLRISKEQLLCRVEELTTYAAQRFEFVSLGLEDASRADEDYLFQVARTALDAGARRIRLSDTLGFWQPLDLIRVVNRFRKGYSHGEISLHLHNDFGLAMGNAVTAIDAGAQWMDASVLGLGERAGIPPLEELVAFLHFRKGCQQYRIDLIPEITNLVARYSGDSWSSFKPVTGKFLFYCESGLHVEGLYKDPNLYEPFPPEKLGLSRRLAIGGKSGLASVRAKLQELGRNMDGSMIRSLTSTLREHSRSCKRPLTDGEVAEIVQQFVEEEQ